ncbi:MAG TPA: glycosyltransferase [Pontiella sp.]
MKIAVLSSISRSAGGLHYSVRGLSKSMADRGLEMRIFSPIDEYSSEDLGLWDPLPVSLYHRFGPLQSSWALRRLLKDYSPDLLHVHGIWTDPQWAAMQYQKKTGTPVLTSPRGMLDPWAVKNSAWKKKVVGNLFSNDALELSSCIHALCRSEAESIRAYGLQNPIAIIPNGVELPELLLKERREGKRKLLFLGRIHPKKGLNQLIKAWSGLERSDWELIIAGWDDGDHEAGLRSMVSDLNSDDSVFFCGPRFGEDKDLLFRSADAFVLPSFSEGLPMSVLEAWAFGLPVVMTEFCNLPEGFKSGAAIQVNPNVESIREGLTYLMDRSDDELKMIGLRGRKLVEEHFCWPAISAQMEAVYEWCITGNNSLECLEV